MGEKIELISWNNQSQLDLGYLKGSPNFYMNYELETQIINIIIFSLFSLNKFLSFCDFNFP